MGQISSSLSKKVLDSPWRGRRFETYSFNISIFFFEHRVSIGIQKGVGVGEAYMKLIHSALSLVTVKTSR